MKYIVTGGAGFVGQKVCAELHAQGREVVSIDLNTLDSKPYRQIIASFNSPQLASELNSETVVIHLAAISTDKACASNPAVAIEVNVLDALQFALLCSEKSVRKFIFASSEWVYPELVNEKEQDEKSEVRLEHLTSIYAMTKLFAENALRTIPDMEILCLRFGIVYGPRSTPGSAPESLLNSVRLHQNIQIGSFRTSRRFIYVDDLTAGIIAAAESTNNYNFRVINLSGDYLISLGEVIATAMEVTNSSIEVTDQEKRASIRNPVNSAFKSTFNWNPKTDLRTGLSNCLSALEA